MVVQEQHGATNVEKDLELALEGQFTAHLRHVRRKGTMEAVLKHNAVARWSQYGTIEKHNIWVPQRSEKRDLVLEFGEVVLSREGRCAEQLHGNILLVPFGPENDIS